MVKLMSLSGRLLPCSQHFHTLTHRSYGALFMEALYNAAHCSDIGAGTVDGPIAEENLRDKTFNFRLPGLNLDYMSFAMFSLVERNPQALLDPMTLQTVANDVFSTFFQHYATTNVTLADGGNVFQSIGATLPFGLPPIINASSDRDNSFHQDTNVRVNTSRTVNAIVSTPVIGLVFSPIAANLSLAIFAFLASITVLVYFPYAPYFKGLPRDVSTLASVIAFVYDSPRLQEWVAANEHTIFSREPGQKNGNVKCGDHNQVEREGSRAVSKLDEVTVGLGFFRGDKGVARWGVELEPVVHANPKHPYTTLVGSEHK